MAYSNKKLLIMGGNPETTALVQTANHMGVYTIVVDPTPDSMAKAVARKAYTIDGLDVEGIVAIAKAEKVDGVLVGVADILIGAYQKVCAALGLPCYATSRIVDVFTQKDTFKQTCKTYGIHGIPEYALDERMDPKDLAKIEYPVMVKPVDNGGGVGMTMCENEAQLRDAVKKALASSRRRKFIVEKYMTCDDMGLYYTFQDGVCAISAVYDRYTSDEQKGCSRVCLGGTYPSKYTDRYFSVMHNNACRMFRDLGIRNGVLMLSAFFENDTFYVYDTGFRLQGEAPHLLLQNIFGYDQRKMLIQFALTGSMGETLKSKRKDVYLRGKWAATLWLLLKEGTIGNLDSLHAARMHPQVVDMVQRLHEGDAVTPAMIGNEKQVLARLYIVCSTKWQLHRTLGELCQAIQVKDTAGRNMLLKHFDIDKALGIVSDCPMAREG